MFGSLPVPPNMGVIISVVLGTLAKRIYIQHAIAALQKARRPGGTVDSTTFERVGGVSRTAAWIAGLLYGALLLAGPVSLYIRFPTGLVRAVRCRKSTRHDPPLVPDVCRA